MPKSHSKVFKIIIVAFFLPLISVAQGGNANCSVSGYTIEAINGIFTKDEGIDGAKANRQAIEDRLSPIHNNEPVTIDYLYNPTHGLIDLSDVAIQKTFEGVNMQDPDFLRILNSASTQLKTQKVLLVAHSQGNFYANNFYKVVTDSGDVSKKSIGVYGVATPANSVAGNGTYRTSGTDTVINRVRRVLPGTVLPKNDDISYLDSDDSGHGHGFREVYLEYRGEEIKKEIEESLSKLSVDQNRPEDSPCINPPKALTTFEKVTGPVVYSTDFALATGAVGLIGAKNLAVGTYHIAVNTVVWTYDTSVAVATWTFNTAVATAQWTYNTAIAVGNSVLNTANAFASATYNVFTGTLMSGTFEENNGATVILATQPVQKSSLVPSNNNQTTVVVAPVAQPQTSSAPTSQKSQTVFVFEPKVQSGTNAPKLVFIGSFESGTISQVLGSQASASGAEEIVIVEEVIGNAGAGIPEPALSAPQCAQTLANDGCLLATTTVHFEWPAAAGADHYLLGKNGEFATTTDTIFDTEIKDFSDYTFEVVAIGADGTASATSTQAVSVASIPIAINEIAWMGTKANTSDEWFEIKNNTGHTIDLTQWELNAKDNTPYLKLAGTIAPHAYLIFERTDDTAVKDVDGEVYGNGGSLWALGNSGEQLSLSYASTTFDQTPDVASSTWAGGSNNSSTTRKTMERYSSRESGSDPENWGTNLGYIKNGTDADGYAIGGTPGAQNSVSTLINKGQDITSDFTLTADEERYVVANTLRVNASSTLTIEPGVEIKFYDGWINVQGHLAVAGTKENPVIIDTFSGNQDGGISVGGGCTDTVYQGVNASATLDYVNIKNINYINAYDDTRLDISNTDLLNSSGGIYAQDTAQVSIASSSIRNTQDNHAVAVYENSQITIASSSITNTIDNDAVGVYDGTMTITNTTIDGAPNGSGVAIYGGTLSIASSTIRNVSDSGVSLSYATGTISNIAIENAGYSGVDVYKSNAIITDTTISGVTGWAGISVDVGRLSIASSTIKNVSSYGISTYNSTSTISNVVVKNGGGDGISLYGGMTTIADSIVSGFVDGDGVAVSLMRTEESRTPILGIVADISSSEITGNATGIEMEAGSTIIAPDVSVHNNVINIIACDQTGVCIEQVTQ